jgi:nucleotide-binding universal stress UspA family protein
MVPATIRRLVEVALPGERVVSAVRAGMALIATIVATLGRRGRSMISRMMLGSVSERALRYAHCPVMAVT